MKYIRNEKLFLKLNSALQNHKLIFITGATGFGKTALIQELLKDYEYDYFSLKNDINLFDVIHDIVVIDDFQFIVDHESLLKAILELSLSERRLVISSRSNPLSYFMDASVKWGICEVKEEDIAFTPDVVHKLLDPYIEKPHFDYIYHVAQGNPLGILLLYEKLSSGTPFTSDIYEDGLKAYYDHLKNMVMDYIDPNVLYFLLQMSVADSFTLEFAKGVALNDNALSLIKKAFAYGNFMDLDKDVYRIRPQMLEALRENYQYYLTDAEYNEFRMNAGRYYEAKGYIKEALFQYESSGNIPAIKRTLLHNSKLNPSHGEYKELKKYYMMLNDSDIASQPVLMSGMSMLYSLILDAKKSDEYYEMLKSRLEISKGAEAKEIRGYLDYLDFALPHRDNEDIFARMRELLEKSENGKLFLQHFSLTSGCPSVIHGACDFSVFISHYEEILREEGALIEHSMGKTHGKGILDIIRAECLYEAGSDEFFILNSLVPGKMKADKHELDNIFVLVRIEAYLALERGDKASAKNILLKFIEDCRVESPHLLTNAIAQYIRILIYTDDEDEIVKWVEESEDENETFFITDRMVMISKVYAYIYLRKYSSAYILLQKLKYYAELYKRNSLMIEIYLLSAIIEYLTDRDYFTNLSNGLSLASSVRLVRLVSNMGILVYEMMEKSSSKIRQMNLDEAYLSVLNKNLLVMANRYPSLFNKESNLIPELSKYGLMILELQANGYSLSEIADRLSLNIETVRYHAKQNYRKLGASGKAEAVSIAKRLQLI